MITNLKSNTKKGVLSKKIIVLILVASAILIAQSIYNLLNLKNIDSSINTMYKNTTNLTHLSNKITMPISEIRILSMAMVMSPNKKLMIKAKNDRDNKIIELENELKKLKINSDSTDIQKNWIEYKKSLLNTSTFATEGIRIASFISVTKDEEKSYLILQEALKKYANKQLSLSKKIYNKAQVSSNTAFYALIITSLIEVLILKLILFLVYTMVRSYIRELKLLASTDPMTKLYNRRYFTEMSKSLLGLARRNKTNSAIIMLDIDKFKNVNDIYGHKVGDDVIISLASILQEQSRKSDIVSRWGGEEFVILLPDTNIDGALVIAEKIRKVSEGLIIKLEDNQEIKFTVSLGISEFHHENDTNIEASINRADEALYEAKETGRNKVRIYNNAAV